MGDIREVHASRCYIGTEQDGRLAVAEALRLTCSLCLLQFTVHLKDAAWIERVRSEHRARLVWVSHLGECLKGHGDFCCRAKVHDCLEWLLVLRICLVLFNCLVCDLHHYWYLVLKTFSENNVLRNSFVCLRLLGVNGADKLKVWSQGASDELDDRFGNSGAEHEGLTCRSAVGAELTWGGHVRGNVLNRRRETDIEETIGFIEDEGLDIGQGDATATVRYDVKNTTGSTDQDVTSFLLHAAEMLALLGSTNCGLYFYGCVAHYLFGFDSNLLSQFTSRGDNQGADVADGGTVSGWSFEVGIAEDSLDNGEQEGQCFARTSSCLCYHVAAVKTVVQGHFLDFAHSVNIHAVGDGVDDSRGDDFMVSKFLELRELGWLVSIIL